MYQWKVFFESQSLSLTFQYTNMKHEINAICAYLLLAVEALIYCVLKVSTDDFILC